MADQVSRQDGNRFPALIAHTGTAGTAEVVRVVATPEGALTFSGSVFSTGGTINAGTVTVTSGSITVVAGTTTITSGTIGSITNLGQIYNAGTIQNMLGGTVTTVSNINNGTIRVTAGTVDITPLAGIILATTTTVGTTATAIPTSALANRKTCILYNTGTATVYMGGSTVTAAAGLPVGTADYSPPMDLGTTILYGIASTAGGTVNILEIS